MCASLASPLLCRGVQLGRLVAMCERLVPAQQQMPARADCERENRQLVTSPPAQPQIDMCLMNGREARFTPQQDPLHAGTPALTPGCGGGTPGEGSKMGSSVDFFALEPHSAER